jgi:histone-lysine N-methyltransferase SETD3
LTYAFTLLLVTIYVGLNLGTLEQAANGAALVLCAQVLKDFVLPKLFKKKRYVICPMIDMANHQSTTANGGVSFEFFGDAYSLAATRDVAQGQEVYISYGARSNDQLLQYYGFVEQDNPHDVYIMPPLREWNIDALEQACGRKFASGRLQKLDRAGLLGTNFEIEENVSGEGIANPKGGVVISRAGGIDPAVMQALRALVSSDEEWAAAGEAIGNFAEELSGGPENERLAKLAAKTAIEMELASKPTTIEEDEALLKRIQSSKSLDSSAEEILPILFRIEKKKLLEETISRLQ